MCGICGIFNKSCEETVDRDLLSRMLNRLHHRGPDEEGMHMTQNIGLGNTRLSIIDLKTGKQPIHNEDQRIWVTLNGEIFNYPELREQLVQKGHVFYTHTDTEVLVHLYEEKNMDMLKDLNGQFAFALWDGNEQQLMIARDRVGICPLFYVNTHDSFRFASEIKALLVDQKINTGIDVWGLQQIFTFWATIPPRTIFENIQELPPAHWMRVKNGSITMTRYWDVPFIQNSEKSITYFADQLEELLTDAVRIRLRADVPVAAYLSGGLDSSFISAIIIKNLKNNFKSFSLTFDDADYDEHFYQQMVVKSLGIENFSISCSYDDIGSIMPRVVWHTETSLIRTAPAPLLKLSGLVRDHGFKVVMTGEGADEMLAGYDLFREAKIRCFWSKNPSSRWRPSLFKNLYQELPHWPRQQASSFLISYYKRHLQELDDPFYSHRPRWQTTSWIRSLFSEDIKKKVSGYDPFIELGTRLPKDFKQRDMLARAQYIEMITLLSGCLLSSQGDRMMMANSVEGRFPFLDHRVIELCARIPATMKLKALQEKYILKKIAKPHLPREIIERKKQGYRSPDSASFFSGRAPEYLNDLLSTDSIKKSGYFDPMLVQNLVQRCRNTKASLMSMRYHMAVVGVITTELLHSLFCTAKTLSGKGEYS